MSGYRGRHRKPSVSHTGRNLAVVAATGAMALPLTEVGVARAANADILDVIEQCESGGQNIPNSTGSSASGFWQITRGTVASLGFSGSAMNHSRAEQRQMAEKLLATRGTQPWNASKHCWGGSNSLSVKSKAAAPKAQRRAPTTAQKRRPAPANTAGVTGARAADGTGRYVCAPDKLFFDACDPDTLGQVVNYPLYDGRHRATPAAAPARAAAAPPSSAASTSRVAAAALGYRGVPYRWGGTTRAGMDCSGLVWTVLRDLGYSPPRTSAAQYAWTRRITAADARPGDLVFHYSPVSHVGIYLGDGKMIDASQPGTRISVHTVYPGAKYGRIPG